MVGWMDGSFLTFYIKVNALALIGRSDVTFVQSSSDVGCLLSQGPGSRGPNKKPEE